jgi:hypothetical protein
MGGFVRTVIIDVSVVLEIYYVGEFVDSSYALETIGFNCVFHAS